MFWLAVISLLVVLWFGLSGFFGARHIQWLDDIIPLTGEKLPVVSVIIPALNEESDIRKALSSVLALDYPGLEIIVINDRSTDDTGAILEQMAACYSQLRVTHITELPPGWLGKNHALHCGAKMADGDYLLFTDADVVMEPSTVSRAMARMRTCKLDHLTLFFKAVLPSSLLGMVVIEFGVSLVAFLKPWKASDPAAHNFIGIGAFNLVRAEAYRQVGGHEAIRLCPLDDIMLGKIIKQHHLRQECLYGYRFVAVRWYGSISEMTTGLMKNTYAALEYSFSKLCLLTAVQLTLSIWPLWALILTEGGTRLVNGAIVVLQGIFFVLAAMYADFHPGHVVWFPLTPYIRLYMTWKAVLATIFHQGIFWRGTFYSLKELRAGRR